MKRVEFLSRLDVNFIRSKFDVLTKALRAFFAFEIRVFQLVQTRLADIDLSKLNVAPRFLCSSPEIN